MEWFVYLAPLPNGVEFSVGTESLFAAVLLVALTPVFLVFRRALGFDAQAESEAPQLRVIEGGKELRQRAA